MLGQRRLDIDHATVMVGREQVAGESPFRPESGLNCCLRIPVV